MSHCLRCGAAFECGMTDAGASQPCWCTQLPTLPLDAYQADKEGTAANRCFCRQCLKALLASHTAVPENK